MTNTVKMTVAEADPELRKALSKAPSLPITHPLGLRLARGLIRLFLRTSKNALKDVAVSEKVVDNGGLRLYEPAKMRSGAALLWIHGGGLILGHPKANDDLCGHYARQLGLVVVSVRYRLAPENPYPAAIDDCFAAWTWLLENAEDLGVDPSRVIVGGQSAGGGLAAALCPRRADTGGAQPAGQWLVYPMLDDRTAANHSLDPIEHLIWNNRFNRFGWSSYLGHEVGQKTTPEWAVPARRQDLSGLPAAWIGVGTLDLFLEENKRYAQRLRDAGVECELDLVEGVPHGFEALAPKASVSMAFSGRAEAFVRRRFGIDQGQETRGSAESNF